MKLFTVGNIVLSSNAINLGTMETLEAKQFCDIEQNSLVVCSCIDMNTTFASFICETPKVRLVIVGTAMKKEVTFLLEKAADRVLVLPYFDSFGSKKYLFSKLKNNEIAKKGILRFVQCGLLEDSDRCKAEIDFTFSSLFFLLIQEFGAVSTKYSKVFTDEDLLRFNAIVRMENGTIVFFEQKYSSQMLPNEYWEYAYRDGLLVSDGIKEMPLCILTEETKRNLDVFRISGSAEEVSSKLEHCSISFKKYISVLQAHDMLEHFDEARN
ncbi:MAG: hypothetical protein ACQ5SW_13055 [Sphaerochaetaceae bacterium]